MLTFVNGQYSASNSTVQNVLIVGWAAVSYILWGMSYTAGDIPIWGITSLMTESEKDRANILGLARIVAGIGGGIVLLSILTVSQKVGNSLASGGMESKKALQWGFIIVAGILTVVGCALFQLACFAKERVKQPSDEHKTIIENFKIMWNCKPFRRVLISGIIRSPMNILSIVAMTLLSYYFGDNGSKDYMIYMIILGGGMFIGQFAAMGAVPKLIEKIEKRKLYNICSLVGAIPFVLIFIMYLADGTNLYAWHWITVMAVLFAVAGGSVGASMVLQSIMIADCVDYDEYHTGYRPDGVFFSGQSFIVKLGAGLSSIIQGIVFSLVGFSGDNVARCNEVLAKAPKDTFVFATDPNFSSYRFGMFFLIAIPPAIGFILSTIPMRKYEITNDVHSDILKSLNEKRNKDSQDA